MAPSRANRSLIDLTISSDSSTSDSGRSKGKAPASKANITSEVIEISDSDEENVAAPAKRRNTKADLERQLKKLKQENDKYRRQEKKMKDEIQNFQKDIAKLQAAAKSSTPTTGSSSSKHKVSISELEDSITCEICTLKMWSPYLLPQCGHTYCLECLQDWFSTTLMQHMNTYPNYNVNDPIQLGQFYLHQQLVGPPSPQYTCPTCRARVRNPPVENFALKTIVQSIATAQGESNSGKKATSQHAKKRDGGKESPWDGFFPRTNMNNID